MKAASIAVFLLAASAICAAQQPTPGHLTIIVKDPWGAVVVGARVDVVAANTGARFEQVANQEGGAQFELAPGSYQLEISQPGFVKTVITRIAPASGQNLSITGTLQPSNLAPCPCVSQETVFIPTLIAIEAPKIPEIIVLQPLKQFPLPSVRPHRRFL